MKGVEGGGKCGGKCGGEARDASLYPPPPPLEHVSLASN